MAVNNRIREIRIAKGMSQGELARLSGYKDRSAIAKIEAGVNDISQTKAKVIADALGVTPADIFGYSVSWKQTESDNAIPAAENIIPMPKMRKIPLVGTIACGTPILAVENIEDQVDIPEHIHADFALRCKGDSMIDADIQDGDIVYIRQQDEVDPGQIAAVLVEDEATLKRFYYDAAAGVVTLVPANSALSPQFYQGETLNHIKILGLAVGLTRCFKQLNYSCI